MIEAICRTYLWTDQAEISRRALVAWDRICLPQTIGDLNVINLCNWNKAAVAKYLWAITKKKDCLWIRWIHSYYIKNKIIDTMHIPKNAAWVVRKAIELRKFILELPTLQGDLLSRLTALQSTDERFSIKKLYKLQTPQGQKVYWKCLICNLIYTLDISSIYGWPYKKDYQLLKDYRRWASKFIHLVFSMDWQMNILNTSSLIAHTRSLYGKDY